MAHQGQQISNPRTGQRIKFLQISPQELRIDTLNPPTDVQEPLHVHPHQESGAEVISGSLVFEVAGRHRTVGSGETITIPANTKHRFWNEGPQDAHAIQYFRRRSTPPRSSRRCSPSRSAARSTAKECRSCSRSCPWSASSATRSAQSARRCPYSVR